MMTTNGDRIPVTVLVRTIGRPQLLRECLSSIAATRPAPAEILVVDQSGGREVSDVVRSFEAAGARVERSSERGTGVAFNVGLRAATHDFVLNTDDDCTVAEDWVSAAYRRMLERPDGIITGQVLAAGDPQAVPSTIDDPEPRDYTGTIRFGALFTNNMACNRLSVLALGGFDERIKPVAEDNDLCYRWLKAGHSLRYVPELVVWHHEWRSHEDLERWYVQYARSQGIFYAKHLRQGDLRMLRYLVWELYAALRGTASRVLKGRPRWSDSRQGIFRGLPAGFVHGWRVFGTDG